MVWDEEADLVVLGSGAAGLTGALVAATEGSSVVLLEKSELVGGTAAVSGGALWIPLNDHMAEVEVDDSRDEALAYMRACAGDQGDDEHLVALVDHGAAMVRYLEQRAGVLRTIRAWPAVGGTIDYRPWLTGWKYGGRALDLNQIPIADSGEWAPKLRRGPMSYWTMDKLDAKTKSLHTLPVEELTENWLVHKDAVVEEFQYFTAGTALVGELLRGCLEQGVTVYTECPGEELVTKDGGVVGVVARRDGDPVAIRARLGVLMATGGYGQSRELKRLWMSRPLELTCEVAENQGDGHLMGMAVGAQVANLGDAWWMPMIPMGDDGYLDGGDVNIGGTRDDRIVPHTMIVNRAGKRFFSEGMNYYDAGEAFGLKEGGSPRNVPAWLIFDEQGRTKYSALAFKLPDSGAGDWITVADSLAELAGKLGIDTDGLLETVERFNGFARDGVDRDFRRGETAWDVAWGDPKHQPNPSLGPLERPPFYAVEVRPGALATKGGLRVNSSGQVISAARPFEPIPGLYAAGNCSNGGPAGAYPGPGSTIGAAMTFAYLAALHATTAVEEAAPSISAN